jgi:hypothetical protein
VLRGAERAPDRLVRCRQGELGERRRREATVPPRGVKPGSKRDRQYEQIKEGYEARGVSEDEAEERAARTVNKERREAGETKGQRKS